MKKLLSILAAGAIGVSGAGSVIACSKDSTAECPPCDPTPARDTLEFLIDYARKTLDDEIDPGIKLCTRVERFALASDIIIGSDYLTHLETPLSKIKELNKKILDDHKILWSKIIECSVGTNNKPTKN